MPSRFIYTYGPNPCQQVWPVWADFTDSSCSSGGLARLRHASTGQTRTARRTTWPAYFSMARSAHKNGRGKVPSKLPARLAASVDQHPSPRSRSRRSLVSTAGLSNPRQQFADRFGAAAATRPARSASRARTPGGCCVLATRLPAASVQPANAALCWAAQSIREAARITARPPAASRALHPKPAPNGSVRPR